MRDNSAVNVDGEVVGRIAGASLRHKDKVPGAIVRGAGLCGGRKGDKTARGCSISKNRFHLFLQPVVIDLEASLSKLSGARHQADHRKRETGCSSKVVQERLAVGVHSAVRIISDVVNCNVLVRSDFTIGHIGGIVAHPKI